MVRLNSKRWCALACVAAFSFTACGDDGGSGASGGGGDSGGEPQQGVEEAKRMVAEAEKPITEGPSAPAFDASGANGKKVAFVSLALSIPYSGQVWSGFQQGGEALGVTTTSYDGKFSPAEVSKGVDLAIQDNADAIVLHALPANVVAPAVKKAEEAGIPVISAETQDPGPALPEVPEEVDAIAGHSYSIPARIMAAKVVADSGGKANAIFFSASDIGPGSKQGTDAFVAKMKELCPDCKVEVQDSPTSQWSDLTQRTSSLLRSNPDVTHLVPIFDGMVTTMLPGIRSAGATGNVEIVTGDATDSVLEAMKSGDVVSGDVGQPNVWTGVAVMDQTARVLAGEEPLEDVGIKYRLFTDNNIDDIDLQAPPSTWYGDVDFLSEYKKIWGVN